MRHVRTRAGVRGSADRVGGPLRRVQELRGRGRDANLRGCAGQLRPRAEELHRARRSEQPRGRRPRSGAEQLPCPLSVRGGRAAAPGGLLGPRAPGGTGQPQRLHILPVSQHPLPLSPLLPFNQPVARSK